MDGIIPSDIPGVLPGEMLSIDEALSDLAELLFDSLPNQTLTLPESVRNAMGNSGFYRGWGGGDNFFVNPNHANTSDSNSGKTASRPLSTATQAVTNAAAMNGDNIWIIQSDSWQYGAQTQNSINEALIIPADKPGLHIIGAGYGSMGVNWTYGVTGTFCITDNALDTVIDGFNFWGTAVDVNGILCDWDDPPYGENAVIRNCTFTEDLNIGIQMEFSWFNEIYNNHFQECTAYGIYVNPAGDGISYVKIHNNRFNDCGAAMALDDCDNGEIYNNRIFNAAAQGGGAATNQGINTSAGVNNIVSDNFFSCVLANWDTFNSAAATDAWINNYVMDGEPEANPA
jgi:hypothetical protein